MTSKKREREYLDSSISTERNEDEKKLLQNDESKVNDILQSEEEIEKYISDNLLISRGCESCMRIKNRAVGILSDSEKLLMVQVQWSNLINNFTYKFVPRLLSKPYSLDEENQKFNKLIEKLILENLEKENNRINSTKEKSIERENNDKIFILPCQHPSIYSTSIQFITPVGSDQTGLAIIDELSMLLHSKELIFCQKFIDKNQCKIGNLYKHELNSLVWSVNGTVYHTGEDNELEYPNYNKEKVQNAHFNIKYSSPELYLPLTNTKLTFVNKPEDLRRMIDDILNSMESHYDQNKISEENNPFLLAIDLEHHSNQSYKGFVSLIQISTRTHDYIIDPFNLFNEIQMLNELTANPRILKVLHGSDYDIIWLQRDFSVYIVNMFDTGQAARILNTPGGFSLKNLLSVYCSIDIDKRFQLADWRVRPLSADLINYARGDTHYLLYVYDIMKNLLLLHTHKKNESSVLVSDAFLEVNNDSLVLKQGVLERFNFVDCIQKESVNGQNQGKLIKLTDLDPSALLTVLHNSRKICLKEYFEKPLDIWNLCFGIRTKMSKSSFKTPIDTAIITLISYYLFIWRDSIARLLDVSASYVLKESMIIKICQKQPMQNIEILELFPNTPANIKKHSANILSIVNSVKNFITSKSEDELFDFNSYISHIYSNIANANTNISDPNKYQVKNNHKIVSTENNNNLNENSTNIQVTYDSYQTTSLKDIETSNSKKVLNNQSIQGTPINSKTRKRVVSIKKNSPDSNDRLAENLFGDSPRTSRNELNLSSNSSLDDNKVKISSKIIQDINKTLNGQVPFDFIDKNNINNIDKTSQIPIKHIEASKEEHAEKEVTFEEYYSEKTKEESLEDKVFSPLVSVRDKFNDVDDYLFKKKKIRKNKDKNDQDTQELSSEPTSSITEKHENEIPDISDLINKNADILPASFACKTDLPGFIKNSQREGNITNKSKKFVESMKTKKWHKKR